MSRVEPNRNVYVGHRYVPKIFGEWDQQNEYEGLSIVTHQGASYTSKKRVPVGIDILNEEFWVVTGNYDSQVEEYRKETLELSNKVKEKTDKNTVKANLIDYGGVNDGTTDNYESFIDMINSDNDSFYIPEGVYYISKPVDINRSNIKIVSDGVLKIDSLESIALSIKGDNNEISVNIDGNLNSRIGIQNNGYDNIIKNCSIINMKSYENLSAGINSEQKGLTIIENNFIKNIISVGNNVKGDDNGASRGVRISGLGTNDGLTLIHNNKIVDILGEEGDAVHLIAPGKEVMEVDIRNNNIIHFTRRAIKMQCSKVKAYFNVISSHRDYSTLERVIDVQYVDDCEIVGNTIDTTYVSFLGLQGYEDNYAMNNIVRDNIITLNGNKGLGYINYTEGFIFKNNIIKKSGVLIVTRSNKASVEGNEFNEGDNSNAYMINFSTDLNDRCTVTNNKFVNLKSADVIAIRGSNITVKGNLLNNQPSRITINGGTGFISDNVIYSPANNHINGDKTNHIIQNNVEILEMN